MEPHQQPGHSPTADGGASFSPTASSPFPTQFPSYPFPFVQLQPTASHPSHPPPPPAAPPRPHFLHQVMAEQRQLQQQRALYEQQAEYQRQLQHQQMLLSIQQQRESEQRLLPYPLSPPQHPHLQQLPPIPHFQQPHFYQQTLHSAPISQPPPGGQPPPPVVPLTPPHPPSASPVEVLSPVFTASQDSSSSFPDSHSQSSGAAAAVPLRAPSSFEAVPPSPTFGSTPPSSQETSGASSPSASQLPPVPTFLASITRAIAVPPSSLASLPPPQSIPPSVPGVPVRRHSLEWNTPCALCAQPLTVDVSGVAGPTPPPCRCMECEQQFHTACAKLKDVDGSVLCTVCRQQRRRQKKLDKKAKKEHRKREKEERRREEEMKEKEDKDEEEEVEEEKRSEADSDVDYEEEAEAEKERQRKKERAKKGKAEHRLSFSHPPSLSLPSSSTTTPAPSAPPSTRSVTSADPASAHVEAFSDFLTAFLDSYSLDAQHAIPYTDRQSSNPLDWSTLTSRLRLCAAKHALALLDVDLLSRLLPFLLSSMEAASVCSLLHPSQRFDAERLVVLLKGLDGALMTLLVMTQKGIERTLMREELLDGLIACLVHTIRRNILPLHDPALRDRPGKPAGDDAPPHIPADDEEDDEEEEEEADVDVDATPSKKKGTPSKGKKPSKAAPLPAEMSAAEAGWWKGTEVQMKEASKKVELLLSLLDVYIRSETTRDAQVLPLIDLCFLVLTAEHCSRLQLCILPLLVAMFLHGDEGRRTSIIDGVVTAFRVSATRKMQRSFALQYPLSSSFRSKFAPMATGGGTGPTSTGGAKIQILVALMLQLIHSISGASSHHEQLQTQHDQLLHRLLSSTSPPSEALLTESRAFVAHVRDEYQATQKASWYFVQAFLDRLQPTATGSLQFKQTQAMVRAVLDDLLLVLFLPEWPAAEQLLHAFVVRMCMVLDRPKGADKTAMNSDRLHLLCILCLGLISQQVKAHEVQLRRAPVTIRPERAIDTQQVATPYADSEITDCICGFRKVGSGGGQWKPAEDGEEGVAADAAETEVPASEEQSFFVDCDSCHVWFHGVCVGLRSEEEVAAADGSWVCESCLMRVAVTQQKLRMERKILTRHSGDFSAFDELHTQPSTSTASDASSPSDTGGSRANEVVLKQLLVNYLDELSTDNVKDALIFARQFHLSQWIAAAVKEDERQHSETAKSSDPAPPVPFTLHTSPEVRLCLVNWCLPGAAGADKKADGDVTLSREGQFRISRQLSSVRELMSSIPLMLDKLLVKCTDPQPQFRAKAVSAVSGVVKVDPSILQQPGVKRALMERVMDPSTSTREAVLDLIGSQVKYQPSLFHDFYPTIVSRSNDVGISVRKRVVRLLQEFLLHPHLRGREDVQAAYKDMVGHLIERMRDEETVQRLVRDIFYHLWFNEKDDAIASRHLTHSALQRRDDDDMAVGSTSVYSPAFHVLVRRIVESVVEVTRHGVVDNLIDIVNALMEQQESGGRKAKQPKAAKGKAAEVDGDIDPKKVHSIRAICTDVCSCVVEQLIQHSDDGTPASGSSPSSAFSALLLASLTALHFFSRIHPPFLVAHAYTLQPYLKLAKEDKALQPAVGRLIEVFTEILPLIRHPTDAFLAHMEKDLAEVILGAALPLVISAVPCLVVLTAITGVRDLLMRLIIRFHSFLVKKAPTEEVRAVTEEGNVIRSLLALGLLLKLCPDDDYARLSAKLSTPKAPAPTVDAVFELFQRYIDLCPVMVKIVAVKGMIALFTRKPTLVPRSEKALKRALGAQAAVDLQLMTLQSLRAFLQSEDARLQRAQKIDQQRTKAQRKKGAEDAEVDEADTAEDDAAMVEDLKAVHSLHDHHGTKKAWLDSRIEVSDFLPSLITLCEHEVYALCFSRVAAVRGEALAFTNVFLHQAVTNPVDAMPPVVALLFDRSQEPPNAAQALSILQSLAEKKKEYLRFIEQRFLQGVRLGHSLQLSVWPAEYDPLHHGGSAGESGAPYETVAQLYSVLKKSSAQRKLIAASLVNDVMAPLLTATGQQPQLSTLAGPTRVGSSLSPALNRSPSTSSDAQTSPSLSPSPSTPLGAGAVVDASPSRAKFGLLCFLAALILRLPFDDDEPLHVLHHLSRLINTRGTALLASVDDCVHALKALEEQINADPAVHASLLPSIQQRVAELSSLCDRAMAMSVLLHLRHSLTVAYSVDGRYEEWNIHTSTVKVAVRLSRRGDIDTRISFHHFPWRSDEEELSGPGVEASPAKSPLKRTPSKRGGHSRQASGQREGAGEAVSLIPALLQRQSSFFAELMSGSAVSLQSLPVSRGKGKGRGKRGSRAVSDDDADSGDDGGQLNAEVSSVHSSTPRQAAPRKAHKAHKKRKSLTFGHDRLENSQSQEAEQQEDDEDDEDWEMDTSSAKSKKKAKKTRGKGKVHPPLSPI